MVVIGGVIVVGVGVVVVGVVGVVGGGGLELYLQKILISYISASFWQRRMKLEMKMKYYLGVEWADA